MDFELSPEDKEFKRRVSEFFDQTLPREYVREFEAKDEYPFEFWREMAQAGYCGLMVPEEWGERRQRYAANLVHGGVRPTRLFRGYLVHGRHRLRCPGYEGAGH